MNKETTSEALADAFSQWLDSPEAKVHYEEIQVSEERWREKVKALSPKPIFWMGDTADNVVLEQEAQVLEAFNTARSAQDDCCDWFRMDFVVATTANLNKAKEYLACWLEKLAKKHSMDVKIMQGEAKTEGDETHWFTSDCRSTDDFYSDRVPDAIPCLEESRVLSFSFTLIPDFRE